MPGGRVGYVLHCCAPHPPTRGWARTGPHDPCLPAGAGPEQLTGSWSLPPPPTPCTVNLGPPSSTCSLGPPRWWITRTSLPPPHPPCTTNHGPPSPPHRPCTTTHGPPFQVLALENIGSSVLVGPDQLPSLHALLTEAAAVLEMEPPELYVRQVGGQVWVDGWRRRTVVSMMGPGAGRWRRRLSSWLAHPLFNALVAWHLVAVAAVLSQGCGAGLCGGTVTSTAYDAWAGLCASTGTVLRQVVGSGLCGAVLHPPGRICCLQNPTPNAFTLAISGRQPFIVVHSALLDLLAPAEVQAVLAHELGACGW